MHRIVTILLASLLTGLVLLPGLLYEIGLRNLKALPVPPRENVTAVEASNLWVQLRETGPIKLQKINPYGYAMRLPLFGTLEPIPGERLAWFVARNHNATNLNDKRNIYWHLSGAALTIWLTQNWTVEQLLSQANEIRARKELGLNLPSEFLKRCIVATATFTCQRQRA